jgi:hypothetical protein
MDDDADGDRLSFLESALPPAFELRAVAVAPGCARAYDPAEWWDAVVVVERGEIVLECLHGNHCCFERGDVLWLAGLPLRALHNRGGEPAVLVAVARKR